MRRTMFVVPLDLAAVMNASCTRALVPVERRKLVAMLEEGGVTDDVDAWIERVGDETVAALRAHGPLPASQLTKLVPELSGQLRVAVGKRYEGLDRACRRGCCSCSSTEGRIARARPLGSWLSSQYRWVPMADWIGGLPDVGEVAARAELVRRWLRAYGPGTLDDLVWWTKWTKANVRAALSGVGAVAVTTDTGDDPAAPAWVLADDLDTTPVDIAAPDGVEPVALLPGLDPTIMGWKHRGWYLGPHRAAAVRPQRQRRPDGVGRRASGRRVEPTRRRRRRGPPARGRRCRRGDPCRRRRPAAHRVDGRRARHPTVPDPARPIDRRAGQREISTPAAVIAASAAAPSPALTSTGAVAARGTTHS